MKLGADPEFELQKDGRHVPASRYINDDCRREKLGLDGASNTGEIRVPPGKPNQMMISLGFTMKSLAKVLPPDVNVFAGSGKTVPTGGHIHFSQVQQTPAVVSCLDRFIAEPLNQVSRNQVRSGRGYGRMGEVRPQPHGWEYRSPCSWIAHPLIARGVLTIAWTIANHGPAADAADLKEKAALDHQFQGPWNILILERIFKKMKKHQVFLEDIDVLQAWKKRNPTGTGTIVAATFNSRDEEMADVMTRFQAMGGEITISGGNYVAGASIRRGAGEYLVVNDNSRVRSDDVETRRDSGLALDTIYLSLDLRRNPEKAARVVFNLFRTTSGAVDTADAIRKMEGKRV